MLLIVDRRIVYANIKTQHNYDKGGDKGKTRHNYDKGGDKGKNNNGFVVIIIEIITF